MTSRLLMRIPLLRRPFYQRDVARRERDAALQQIQEFHRVRDEAPRSEREDQRSPPDDQRIPTDEERSPPDTQRSQPDIAAWFGFDQFYWHPANDAEQDRRIGDFRNFISLSVPKDRPVAEFGPSTRPIIPKRLGFNVTTVDHADEQEITAKYANQGFDTSQIEPVDVVWTGDKLAPAMPCRDMAAIVASHMIEHATDFIGFLNDCADMLAPDGQIFLIVPDRRYCFDFLHPISDVAKVLNDHRQKRRVHSFESLFRNSTNLLAHVSGSATCAWGQTVIDDISFMNGDPHVGLQFLRDTSEYIDSHENYFTPSSFVLLIEELRYLGVLQLTPHIITRSRGCEFLVSLRRTSQADRPAMPIYLERKKFLVLNMLREEREQLQYIERLLDF